MTNKIHIKLGPIEFEAEGDSELIERERAQFFTLLPQAISAVSPVVPSVLPPLEIKNEENYSEVNSSRPSLIEQVKTDKDFQGLVDFLNQKKFSTGVELVMGVAYYLQFIENLDTFSSRDIEKGLEENHQNRPNNIPQALNQNIKKGYLREGREKKEGLKTYCVLERGKNWCENYIGSATSAKKKTVHAKSQKKLAESTLIQISLDELNLDKYCSIDKLEKFNEQVLVVMLIYTQEKSIEYFSFYDIVSVFKTKFKLKATTRQVRYVFDSGGTMFDKKVEKKIVLHKLMSRGIKEAERIIQEQKEKSLDEN